MLAKVHSVKQVLANKNHVCSFSGVKISKGSLYYTLTFHPGDSNFEFDAETFETYKVSLDHFADFIKASVYFVTDCEKDELRSDVEVVESVLHAFWNKWRDKAGISDLLKSVKNRLKLPV